MTMASVGTGPGGGFFHAIARGLGAIVSALVLAALIAASPLAVTDALARYASFVMEADTGRVLYARTADTRNYPESLSKMLTLFLLFQALEQGKLPPADRNSVGRGKRV